MGICVGALKTPAMAGEERLKIEIGKEVGHGFVGEFFI